MLAKYLSAEGYQFINGVVSVKKLHPDAEILFKENQYDAAWELTVISRDENRVEDSFQDVNVFNTGLSITGPKGYHFEVIEHPQLWKAGYSLVGGPRIVNPEDDSEIQIPLYKFREVEDIELPFRAALLIMRQTEHILINPEGVVKTKSKGKHRDDYEDEEVSHRKTRGTRSRRKNNMF
jgi:hypothetical protein